MSIRIQTYQIAENYQPLNVHGRHQTVRKKLETLIQIVIIYSQDLRMKFGIEKGAMLVMKSVKLHMTEGIDLPNQGKIEHSRKRKRTNTWEYWQLTPPKK